MDTITHADAPANAGSTSSDNAAKPEQDHSGTPVVQALFQRAVSGAHDAVDGAAAKIAPAVNGMSTAKETKDEWIAAARDTIRAHPFAAMATALLAGAAYMSLTSSRSR